MEDKTAMISTVPIKGRVAKISTANIINFEPIAETIMMSAMSVRKNTAMRKTATKHP